MAKSKSSARTRTTGKKTTRTAAQRALRGSRGGRGTWIGVGAVAVVVVAIVVGVVLSTGGGSAKPTPVAHVPDNPIRTASGRTTQPPWPVPANPADAVHAAGLPMLGTEGTVEHIHAHLDVFVGGKPVQVPAGIGIDRQSGKISPLHAHDNSGVIHIESPKKAPFTLGQFFTEWQVKLTGHQIGGLTQGGGKTLRAYVNGKQVTGNPAAITLKSHEEVALVYGPANGTVKIPNSYAFPPGE